MVNSPMLEVVTLKYRPSAPSHYVARLGTGGWFEAHGWTEDDAVLGLAEAIREADETPAWIPAELVTDTQRLVGLLRERAGTPLLDE